jgi:hypothetical protein
MSRRPGWSKLLTVQNLTLWPNRFTQPHYERYEGDLVMVSGEEVPPVDARFRRLSRHHATAQPASLPRRPCRHPPNCCVKACPTGFPERMNPRLLQNGPICGLAALGAWTEKPQARSMWPMTASALPLGCASRPRHQHERVARGGGRIIRFSRDFCPSYLGREDSNLGIAVDMLDNARALPTCSQRQQQQQTARRITRLRPTWWPLRDRTTAIFRAP